MPGGKHVPDEIEDAKWAKSLKFAYSCESDCDKGQRGQEEALHRIQNPVEFRRVEVESEQALQIILLAAAGTIIPYPRCW